SQYPYTRLAVLWSPGRSSHARPRRAPAPLSGRQDDSGPRPEVPRPSADGLAAFVFSGPRLLRPDSARHGSATGVVRAHAALGPALRILLWLPPRRRHRQTSELPHAGRAR